VFKVVTVVTDSTENIMQRSQRQHAGRAVSNVKGSLEKGAAFKKACILTETVRK
jgi:hypothetical protein